MNVVILGAGGLGKVILEALQSQKKHRVIGFLDDQKTEKFCKLPILGKIAELPQFYPKAQGVCLAVGDRFLKDRLRLIEQIMASSFKLVNAIHKTAWVSPTATLGKGLYVGPLACIHSGASVGNFSVIWTSSIIEHDVRVGENVCLCPAVRTAGYAEIERDVFVGIGAIILRSKIGNCATVAAGSLVTRNVAAKTLVMGHPARSKGRKTTLAYYK